MLVVCQKKANDRNPLINSAFKAFKVAAIEVFDYCAKYYWDAPSHQWNKGHYERGSKDGTYKPLTKLHKSTQIQIGSRILL